MGARAAMKDVAAGAADVLYFQKTPAPGEVV